MKETTAVPFFLSPSFCSHNGVALLEEGEEGIRLGHLGPLDERVKNRIQNAWPNTRFRYSPLSKDEFALAMSRLYSRDNAALTAVGRDFSESASIDRIEDDAPIVNLLNAIFLEAVSLNASDIHIESEAAGVTVRFRVDGRLRIMSTLPTERGAALSARLKHLANLNIIERRRPQDGRLTVVGLDRSLDVRVSFVPTVRGESIVLRLLNADDAPLSLDSLGFAERELRALRLAIRQPSGLILVTGPTGSGKTTTLSAILREIQHDDLKIVSIEDPVEYRLRGITQIQIDEALDLSFDAVLRRVFRQDPDIIMLGEIRDGESARLAARAALTGHLVFATLHATGALETVPRLLNLGVEPYLIGSVLRMSLAQRLVRRICLACGGAGCRGCGSTGYFGRIVLAETLPMTDGLRACLETGYSAGDFYARANESGFRPLRDDGLEKVSMGLTDEHELKREIG